MHTASHAPRGSLLLSSQRVLTRGILLRCAGYRGLISFSSSHVLGARQSLLKYGIPVSRDSELRFPEGSVPFGALPDFRRELRHRCLYDISAGQSWRAQIVGNIPKQALIQDFGNYFKLPEQALIQDLEFT